MMTTEIVRYPFVWPLSHPWMMNDFQNSTQSTWRIHERNESALIPADLQTVTKVNVRSVMVTKRKQTFF